MQLRRSSVFDRTTVSQEIRQIVEPEVGAPPGSWREVQLLIPLEPVCFVTLEPDAAQKFGVNRTYKLPVIPPGAQVTINILADQGVWAAAKSGMALIAVTVEFHQ